MLLLFSLVAVDVPYHASVSSPITKCFWKYSNGVCVTVWPLTMHANNCNQGSCVTECPETLSFFCSPMWAFVICSSKNVVLGHGDVLDWTRFSAGTSLNACLIARSAHATLSCKDLENGSLAVTNLLCLSGHMTSQCSIPCQPPWQSCVPGKHTSPTHDFLLFCDPVACCCRSVQDTLQHHLMIS
jgi:hypothetical protein